MKKNYTVLFILLFSASITGGLALDGVVEYSMLFGYGMATIFLLLAGYAQGRRSKKTE
ncbi:hypothetical protein [Pseudalkalibacillus berkeleyi]|uniref:DUF5325 family protein n=1 Tax=Pseudalkalibacillus berkeleyi TaxID=1069813 RepID=A0ABS9GY62_9BACL|nr:hypothetical protein [Pseudalkalibacillus berkeleyi]MCF6136477.1 hypothetical protein [Pseudalkalibacillus berkeleyi]